MRITPAKVIKPQPGRQEEFLSSSADICIYGGAAGGGKTYGLLLDPLHDVDVPEFGAVIMRRTYPEVTNQGGMWDVSENIYPHAKAEGVKGSLQWRFPSGARVEFGHCQYESELSKFDGAQICDLCFDQLEHFSEKQFFYLLIRNRSTCGVPPRVRGTCNPDPDSWLVTDKDGVWGKGFLSWWIDSDGYAILERAGVLRWFVRWNDEVIWGESKEELKEQFPELMPKSVTFIPATVYDNLILLITDPGYLANLQAQGPIERARFLGDPKRGGNWKARAEAGKVFNRQWFDLVAHAPAGGVECRGFDLAATMKSQKNDDPDFNTGVKIRKVKDTYIVVDAIKERMPAGEVEGWMFAVIARDMMMARASATRYMVRWEIEPGSASIRESERLKRELIKKYPGLDCEGIPSAGDKVVRANAYSTSSSKGKVKLLAASWNDVYLAELHGFPDLSHDDLIDGSSVAYNAIESIQEYVRRDSAPNPWTTINFGA